MRFKEFLTERDDAVSPVIGVILMVAITVILAAVIASFVLGLGPSDAAPTVNFDDSFEENDPSSGDTTGTLTVSVTGGDAVPASQLSFSGDVHNVSGDDSDFSWPAGQTSTTVDGESAIQAGDDVDLGVDSLPYEVNLVWESDGTSQTLTTFEG